MTLAPLLDASPVIQIHAYLAFAAIALGAAQFALPKGVGVHRATGWLWALAMIGVAGVSLFIHMIRTWGLWSPIHLFVAVHAGDGSAGGPGRAARTDREPSLRDDLAVLSGACRDRALHPLAGTDHASRRLRGLMEERGLGALGPTERFSCLSRIRRAFARIVR